MNAMLVLVILFIFPVFSESFLLFLNSFFIKVRCGVLDFCHGQVVAVRKHNKKYCSCKPCAVILSFLCVLLLMGIHNFQMIKTRTDCITMHMNLLRKKMLSGYTREYTQLNLSFCSSVTFNIGDSLELYHYLCSWSFPVSGGSIFHKI